MVTGIIIMPLYLQYLGAEAYGLVGVFVLMQAWLYLLDMGLSPTLSREIAHTRGKGEDFKDFKKLLRSFEIIFIIITVLVTTAIISSSNWVAKEWINAGQINNQTIAYCISIMGLLIGLRFFSSLYRSGINGMERQVWLNIANTIFITLKFIGALLLLKFVSTDIKHYFEYQLIVGVAEALILVSKFYKMLPGSFVDCGIKFSLKSIRKIAPFTLSIAYTAAVWVVIMHLDKLVLSGVLSLSEFGYFTLVSLAAGGLIQLFTPVMQALLPRMTALVAAGKNDEMIYLYRNATQFVSVIMLATAFVMAAYGQQLLYAWTYNSDAANWGSKVLFWFVLGNAVVALNSFQYNLQYAYGDLKLHVKGSSISAVIQIPIIYYAANRYGAIGAGIAWFGFRLLWFLLWTPIIHKKFFPQMHLKWMFIDIIPIVVAGFVGIYIISMQFDVSIETRLSTIFDLFQIYLIMLIITSMGSIGFIKWIITKCNTYMK